MRLALQLAEKGSGWVSPNPLVGAIIVKAGRIIGQGYHERYGKLHAEQNALASCTESTQGATIYVTLEPCCHQGKQPPCVDAILAAGICRVVVGSADPNPLVAGKGIRILREHNIDVTEHVLQEECDRLNQVFLHYIQTNQPFVIMKYAMTLDGKIAAYTGASKWITGAAARNHVQQQRHRYSAIMVGVGTVLADDPLLTCRMGDGKTPLRIICDSQLRLPLSTQIVATAEQVPTVIATCCIDPQRHRAYEDAGCRIMAIEQKDGHVNLRTLMQRLGEENVDSILLEGGGTLNWSALASGIVQKVQAYLAPQLLGGQTAPTPVAGAGFATPSAAVALKNTTITRLGEDYLLEGEVNADVYRDC